MEALASRVRRVEAGTALEELERASLPRAYVADGDVAVASGAVAHVVTAGPDRFQAARTQAEAVWRGATLECEGEVPPGVGPRFMGGFGFEERAVGGPWAPFGALRFWLPARQLHFTAEGVFEVLNEVQGAPEPPPGPGPTDPDALPASLDVAGWDDAVRQVLAAIGDGSVSKVVLSRNRRTAPADPRQALAALCLLEPSATHFLLDVGPATFYGATPERLVVREGDRVETHALAGTAPAGTDAGETLRRSPKDILEHELVTTYIRGRLEGLGAEDVHQERRRVQVLRSVQHLETPILGRTDRHVLDVAAALHPTPAVCGLPPRASLAWIKALEPSRRGWYTGAVGWFDAQGHGRLHVALRCALSTPDATWLHAGAGIVSDSDPRMEWEETEHKLRSIEAALAEVNP